MQAIVFIQSHFNATMTVAAAMALVGLAAFFAFRVRLYAAAAKRRSCDIAAAAGDAVTVVVVCRDEGEMLERTLPAIMNQRGVDFEVVVVDDCSDDTTPDVIKRMMHRYPSLRHTFVPRTARYVSHGKLAVTLGVKAARNPWIVLTRPTCAPLTDLWLKSLAAHFAPGTDVVLGYANYADDGTAAARRAVFGRLQWSMACMLSALRHAAGGDGANLAFRRSAFLEKGGYADSLDKLFGTDDLLVYALSQPGNTAVCTAPTAVVREYAVNLRRAWRRAKLQLTASLAYLPRRANAGVAALWAAGVGHFLWLAGWVLAAVAFFVTARLLFAAATVAVAVAVTVTDIMLMRRVSRTLGERVFVFSLLWYETVRPLSALLWKMRAFMHRRDFTRKI
jgi:hypothetical protein